MHYAQNYRQRPGKGEEVAARNAAWYRARKEAGNPTWVPSGNLPPEKLERRRAQARERQRRRQDAGLIPKHSELSPEQQEHARELARERKRRYRERKAAQAVRADEGREE
jgi:hypothetical protein